MGNGQLALIRNREVASLQGLLNKVSLVDFNPDLIEREALIKRLAALQGWPLRGVPL